MVALEVGLKGADKPHSWLGLGLSSSLSKKWKKSSRRFRSEHEFSWDMLVLLFVSVAQGSLSARRRFQPNPLDATDMEDHLGLNQSLLYRSLASLSCNSLMFNSAALGCRALPGYADACN